MEKIKGETLAKYYAADLKVLPASEGKLLKNIKMPMLWKLI
jgi:hypothetical protein